MKFIFEVKSGMRHVTQFDFDLDLEISSPEELLAIEQWFNSKTNVRVHIHEDMREKEK